VTVADQPVTNTAQLLSAVAALRPQSEAAIGVQRGDKTLQLKVTVAQRPKAQVRGER
jgi:S1-C subfamily serine protease